MNEFIRHIVLDNSFLLTSSRCVFWEEEKALILSDLHFGKTGHFRKHGIAVPQTVVKEDLQRLSAQIQFYKPSYLIIVGDLFHSYANKEMDLFLKWRKDFEHIGLKLVAGNHDILENDWYLQANIEMYESRLHIGPFIFTHDKAECEDEDDCYIFSGHVHPSIILSGGARQHLRFPCFYFNKTHAILPAFGKFTGTYSITPKRGDKIYALVGRTIVKV